jgi:hypothetical protein
MWSRIYSTNLLIYALDGSNKFDPTVIRKENDAASGIESMWGRIYSTNLLSCALDWSNNTHSIPFGHGAR